jgi:hypothetical protein
VRVAYLISRLERRLGRFYRGVERLAAGSGLGDRLVTVDLGDIVTLFARKPSLEATARRNGYSAP